MDDAVRARLFNACQPGEALPVNDPRYVELDESTDEGPTVRGRSWVTQLARRIAYSAEPVCEYFTGLPGSGKTTALLRLASRLESEGFLPVLVRGDLWFQTTAPIDVPDLWTVIVWRLEAAVLALEGVDEDRALHDGYLTRFWVWLTRTEVGVPKFEVGGVDPVKTNLVLEFRDNPALREQMRLRVRMGLPTFLDDARREITALDARARAAGRPRGIAVLVDSLERLRGASSNWHAVLDSAEALFAGGGTYVKLPVPVVYTVPPALVTLRTMRNLHFLPMIKRWERDGREWEPGFAAAARVVRRRVAPAHLAELLGPTSQEARLRQLISWSGGYPRELLRLVQNALLEDRVDDQILLRMRNDLVEEYRQRIPAEAFPWLARVAHERYATLERDDQRRLAEGLLLDNAVLRYANDEPWFDLHPAVRLIPGVQQAIEALRPSRGLT